MKNSAPRSRPASKPKQTPMREEIPYDFVTINGVPFDMNQFVRAMKELSYRAYHHVDKIKHGKNVGVREASAKKLAELNVFTDRVEEALGFKFKDW